jgi:hypothetical protein
MGTNVTMPCWDTIRFWVIKKIDFQKYDGNSWINGIRQWPWEVNTKYRLLIHWGIRVRYAPSDIDTVVEKVELRIVYRGYRESLMHSLKLRDAMEFYTDDTFTTMTPKPYRIELGMGDTVFTTQDANCIEFAYFMVNTEVRGDLGLGAHREFDTGIYGNVSQSDWRKKYLSSL